MGGRGTSIDAPETEGYWDGARPSPIRPLAVVASRPLLIPQTRSRVRDRSCHTTVTTTGPDAVNTVGIPGDACAWACRLLVVETDIGSWVRRDGVHSAADRLGWSHPKLITGQVIGSRRTLLVAGRAAVPVVGRRGLRALRRPVQRTGERRPIRHACWRFGACFFRGQALHEKDGAVASHAVSAGDLACRTGKLGLVGGLRFAVAPTERCSGRPKDALSAPRRAA